MRIGFDGKRAIRNNTGLGNYSRLVINSLAEYRPENEYRVYSPSGDSQHRLSPRPNVGLVLPDSVFGRKFGILWRTGVGGGLSRQLVRDGVMLYHGLSNEIPLNIGTYHIPSVVTIHDLIYRRCPEMYKAADRAIYNYKYGHSAHLATRVIAISECTKRDLIELQGVDEGKIDVIYQGCDPIFRQGISPEEISEVKMRYGLDRPYIIGVGTIERRKNQLLSVKALHIMDDKDIDLVLVGRQTAYADEIRNEARKLGLSDRVKLISEAQFVDFPALYAGALVSTYPSRYEGYGLPVVESLAVGTPVVVASGSCLEEAGGQSAPVIDPDNAEGLAYHIGRLIFDSEHRNITIDKGRRHALSFDDKKFADAIFDTYHRAIKSQTL